VAIVTRPALMLHSDPDALETEPDENEAPHDTGSQSLLGEAGARVSEDGSMKQSHPSPSQTANHFWTKYEQVVRLQQAPRAEKSRDARS
jgi:hypothetical protein